MLFAKLGIPVSEPTLEIVLPAGISFFTFQSMSYTIDVYRRVLAAAAELSRLRDVHRVSFRSSSRAPSSARSNSCRNSTRRARLADVDVRRALVLFAVGYFKKACIADNVAAAHRSGVREPDCVLRRRSRCSRPCSTPCRSTATSPATRTWRSRRPRCSATSSPRTSTRPTSAATCANSGSAGTSACRPGCATTSTSRSAEIAADRRPVKRLASTMLLVAMAPSGYRHRHPDANRRN